MKMKICDVKTVVLDDSNAGSGVVPMLPGEIPGAEVFLHDFKSGESRSFAATPETALIFMTVSGDFQFRSGAVGQPGNGRWVFIPGCGETAEFTAGSQLRMLEIRWRIPEDGREQWRSPEREFPYVCEYLRAVQYRDANKSDKTINRELVRQRIVPGFCMGTVESYGYDKVAQHPHPMLDQFFFSFPENDVEVLIDDIRVPMKGNTLLHIPLGSNHGVEVTGDRHMHYVWIDFFLGQAGLDRLDRSHKPTGVMRSF